MASWFNQIRPGEEKLRSISGSAGQNGEILLLDLWSEAFEEAIESEAAAGRGQGERGDVGGQGAQEQGVENRNRYRSHVTRDGAVKECLFG